MTKFANIQFKIRNGLSQYAPDGLGHIRGLVIERYDDGEFHGETPNESGEINKKASALYPQTSPSFYRKPLAYSANTNAAA